MVLVHILKVTDDMWMLTQASVMLDCSWTEITLYQWEIVLLGCCLLGRRPSKVAPRVLPHRPVLSQGSLCSQGLQSWDRASESHGPPWYFASIYYNSLRNVKKDHLPSVWYMCVWKEQVCSLPTILLTPKGVSEEETSSSKESDLALEEQLLRALVWCKFFACCLALLWLCMESVA